MLKEEIQKLSEIGEKEHIFNSNEEKEDLAITPPSGKRESQFNLNDINEKFKSFYLRDPLILLVGSCATQGEGVDIDLVMKDNDFPDILKEGNRFRLLRQMSGEFDIDYEDTPDYLHIHDESMGSYTDYFPLYRLKVERIPNQEVHKMSVDDESDSENFEVLSKSKDFIIGGICSTTDVDLENERISENALKEIWQSLKKTPDEFRGLYDSHSSTCIGSLIMEYKNHKCALIDNSKLYLIFKLRNDMPIAQKMIKAIKSGELGAFSIKFGIKNPKKNLKEVCDEENHCITEILGGTYFLEVSTTASPSNPKTTMEVLSK